MPSDEWPLAIDGDEFYPVPESWIEHGSDQDTGSPRIYAVSVASGPRNLIAIRYASPDGRVVEVSTNGAENPSGGGIVPASLAKKGDWPRSLVPSRHVEPTDVLRSAETEHFRELWSDRLQERDAAERDRRVATDGGTDSCPECDSSAFYPNGGPGAFWCEECELEFWEEGSGWYCCGVDGEPRAVDDQDPSVATDGGSPHWSPSDLGLDVPPLLEAVSVHNSDLRVDVDELQEEIDLDLRDPDQLVEERDSALERAREDVDDVPELRTERSAIESIRLESARNLVVGAMRAEYLRRNCTVSGGESR